MDEIIFELTSIRIEIYFKSFDELRHRLSFCQNNNISKINIPCKNNLKKDFLLDSIKISREEFPDIDVIPHFSILHEFKKNKINTLVSFMEFLKAVKGFDCNEVLLVSGSQKRSTLDSLSTLRYLKENTLIPTNDFSIGVAFNPYLSGFLFEEEIIKLEKKIYSGFVKSIWIQFGTDCTLFESRIEKIKEIIFLADKVNSRRSNIKLFGSILIPSKQFLAKLKFRPWKGVYCSNDFLESVDFANNLVENLLKTYKKYNICPIIETDVLSEKKLDKLKMILKL